MLQPATAKIVLKVMYKQTQIQYLTQIYNRNLYNIPHAQDPHFYILYSRCTKQFWWWIIHSVVTLRGYC